MTGVQTCALPISDLLRRGDGCQADRCFSKKRGLDVLLTLVHELALELDAPR